jgi:hypothetical protein
MSSDCFEYYHHQLSKYRQSVDKLQQAVKVSLARAQALEDTYQSQVAALKRELIARDQEIARCKHIMAAQEEQLIQLAASNAHFQSSHLRDDDVDAAAPVADIAAARAGVDQCTQTDDKADVSDVFGVDMVAVDAKSESTQRNECGSVPVAASTAKDLKERRVAVRNYPVEHMNVAGNVYVCLEQPQRFCDSFVSASNGSVFMEDAVEETVDALDLHFHAVNTVSVTEDVSSPDDLMESTPLSECSVFAATTSPFGLLPVTPRLTAAGNYVSSSYTVLPGGPAKLPLMESSPSMLMFLGLHLQGSEQRPQVDDDVSFESLTTEATHDSSSTITSSPTEETDNLDVATLVGQPEVVQGMHDVTSEVSTGRSLSDGELADAVTNGVEHATSLETSRCTSCTQSAQDLGSLLHDDSNTQEAKTLLQGPVGYSSPVTTETEICHAEDAEVLSLHASAQSCQHGDRLKVSERDCFEEELSITDSVTESSPAYQSVSVSHRDPCVSGMCQTSPASNWPTLTSASTLTAAQLHSYSCFSSKDRVLGTRDARSGKSKRTDADSKQHLVNYFMYMKYDQF